MNIGHILTRINSGDYQFFLDLNEEEVKELSPYVLALWLRGADENRGAHTFMTDMMLNTKLFSLSAHPKLLYTLACYANCDMDKTKYRFIPDKKENSGKVIGLIAREFACTEKVAKMYEKFLNEDDIEEIKEKFEEVDK